MFKDVYLNIKDCVRVWTLSGPKYMLDSQRNKLGVCVGILYPKIFCFH